MTSGSNQGFPQINAPIVDQGTGRATQPWYQLFIALWNRTGGASGTASSILDQITPGFGSLLFRGATVWQGLSAPSGTPRVLTYQGGDSPLVWGSAGVGSVTSVATGTGLAGGPITTSGTVSVAPHGISNSLLAQMPANTFKGNDTASTADATDLSVARSLALLGVTTVGTAAAGQIPGTATNDNAASGKVGEILSTNLASGSAVSLATGTAKDVVTLSLTAGDWDVWGVVNFSPAGTTTISHLGAWVSLTTAAFPTLPSTGVQDLTLPFTAGSAQALGTGETRVSIASTTTVYLSAISAFGTSTMSAYGIIFARRAR